MRDLPILMGVLGWLVAAVFAGCGPFERSRGTEIPPGYDAMLRGAVDRGPAHAMDQGTLKWPEPAATPGYWVDGTEYIKILNDGRTVTCIFVRSSVNRGGGLSCDWGRAAMEDS